MKNPYRETYLDETVEVPRCVLRAFMVALYNLERGKCTDARLQHEVELDKPPPAFLEGIIQPIIDDVVDGDPVALAWDVKHREGEPSVLRVRWRQGREVTEV